MRYYDTCALINRGREVFESDEKFYISTITFRELEQIKQSAHKGPDVKQKVRRLLKLLDENYLENGLSARECKDLSQVIVLYNNLQDILEKEIYFKGGMDAYYYFKRIGIID